MPISEIAILDCFSTAETAVPRPDGSKAAGYPRLMGGDRTLEIGFDKDRNPSVWTTKPGSTPLNQEYVNFYFSRENSRLQLSFHGDVENFIPLVCDFIEVISNRNIDPQEAWIEVIEATAAMVKRKHRDHLSLVGLAGELFVLEDLIQKGAKGAVTAWQRDDEKLHDFIASTFRIEVKSTSRRGSPTFEISGVEQLHSTRESPLYFAGVQLRVRSNEDKTAISLRDLANRVKSAIPTNEIAIFTSRLANRPIDTLHLDPQPINLSYYRVVDGFPRLLLLPTGITIQSYTVSLATADQFRLSEADAKNLAGKF